MLGAGEDAEDVVPADADDVSDDWLGSDRPDVAASLGVATVVGEELPAPLDAVAAVDVRDGGAAPPDADGSSRSVIRKAPTSASPRRAAADASTAFIETFLSVGRSSSRAASWPSAAPAGRVPRALEPPCGNHEEQGAEGDERLVHPPLPRVRAARFRAAEGRLGSHGARHHATARGIRSLLGHVVDPEVLGERGDAGAVDVVSAVAVHVDAVLDDV